MPCSSIRAASICSASAIGASAPASLMCASMSLACASRLLTSLLALAGEISFIRELTSTGNGSESAKCSHGSPSGNDITSGNRENDRNATYDEPAGCSRQSRLRALCTCPSASASISPAPQRPAEPLRLIGPLGDLGRGDRLVIDPHGLLTGLVDVDELGEHTAGQLGP